MKRYLFSILICIISVAYTYPVSGDNSFRLLQYNIQQRPSYEGGKHQLSRFHSTRSKLSTVELPKEIKKFDADVVTINEAFTRSLRRVLINRFKKNGYPYHTNVANRVLTKAWSSGVMVFSKYPIQTTKDLQYTVKGNIVSNHDVMAAKGAQYVKVIKDGSVYHIFATHPNASYVFNQDTGVPLHDIGRGVRRVQFKELKRFIDAQKISPHEPVIIAGDMNMDMWTEQKQLPQHNEYAYMLAVLNATDLEKTGHPYTFDDQTNEWTKHGRRYLDYVLYSNGHRRPKRAMVNVVCLKTEGVTTCEKGREGFYRDLSDHYPVIADFIF